MLAAHEKNQAEIRAREQEIARLKKALEKLNGLEADRKFYESRLDDDEQRNMAVDMIERINKQFCGISSKVGSPYDIEEKLADLEARIASLRTQVTTSVAKAARSNRIPPSAYGVASTYLDVQKRMNFPILPHRPACATGVPVSIFCPVFAEFQQNCATISIDATDMRNALDFTFVMSDVYAQENARTRAGKESLKRYFSFGEDKIGDYQADGVIRGAKSICAIFQFKNELGSGGACPVLQAARYFDAWVGSLESDRHASAIEKSHIPCFLIAIAGPHMMVFGAVRSNRILVDPLVSVMLYHQVDDPKPAAQVARTLRALKEAMAKLELAHTSKYEDVTYPPLLSVKRPRPADLVVGASASESSQHSNSPHSDEHPSSTEEQSISFKYTESIGHKALYRVTSTDGAKMILKITAHYFAPAHQCCDQHGYAPKLIGYEAPGVSGFHTVLMEDLSDKFVLYAESPPSDTDKTLVLDALKKALTLLHGETMVHGDARPTNVLYRIDEIDGNRMAHVKLIDFEFAGVEGEGRYPLTMNPDKGIWHAGAEAGALLHRDHDLHQLDAMLAFTGTYDYTKPPNGFDPLLLMIPEPKNSESGSDFKPSSRSGDETEMEGTRKRANSADPNNPRPKRVR